MKSFALSALLLASSLVAADDAALRQCSALPDAERLACYDQQMKAAPAAAPATEPAAETPVTETPAAEAAAEPEVAEPEDNNVVTAKLAENVERWWRGTRVKLDNGMVFECTETSKYRIRPSTAGAAVTARRTMLGTWRMKVEGHDFEMPVKPAD